MSQKEPVGYRFEAFEVQLDAETLTHHGMNVRIQQVPFHALVILLENAGRVVPREELHRLLWKETTSVEYDNSLRVAVTKLREALGEQAAEPRLIRTVARKGYQFIGEVTVVSAPVIEPALALVPTQPAGPATPVVVIDVAAARLPRLRLGTLAIVMAACVVVMLFCAGLAWNWNRPLASEKDTIALGSFSNESHDAAFDGVLTTAFRLKLQESPYLSALNEQDLLRLSEGGDPTMLLKRQLSACRSLGGSLLLDGRLLSQNPGYGLESHVVRCADGRVLDTVRVPAATQADVLPALNLSVERLRRRLGESEASLEKYNVPLTQATTASLFALRAFMQGTQLQSNGQEMQSISSYKLAIDLDPQFAMAYARLGTAYLNSREYSAARNAIETAFRLRERATDRQRLSITAHYYSTVTGELARAIEAYELWRTVYPRDVVPVDNLAGNYLALGDVEKAYQMARLAAELAPNAPASYALLARAELGTGHYDDLETLCRDPRRQNSELVLFHSACFLAASVQDDSVASKRELAWAHGSPQESVLLEYKAWVEMRQGRFLESRKTFAEARESALKRNLIDFAAELDLDEAGLEADLGQDKQAISLALDAIRLAPNSRQVQAFSALALARAGESALASTQAAKATAQAPLDAMQRNTLIAASQAAVQLRQGSAPAAIQSLEPVRPFDDVAYMALSPAYYRGLALAETGQYDAAAVEFEHVMAHAALYPQSLYSVLAELHLARMMQLTKHPDEAMKHYDAVARTWRTAEPTFPPLLDLARWREEKAFRQDLVQEPDRRAIR